MTTDPSSAEAAWEEVVEARRRGEEVAFAEQWDRFRELVAARPPELAPAPAWRPSPSVVEASNLGAFMNEVGVPGYRELQAWATRDRAGFWKRALERVGMMVEEEPETTLEVSRGPEHARWLPGASLSCVASCFRVPRDRPAIVAGAEGSNEVRVIRYGELDELTRRVAEGFREHGFLPGDGIALYLPMTVECVATYLGIIRAGGHVVSIADSFPPPEVRRRLDIAEPRGAVTVDIFRRAGRTFELYRGLREAGAPRTVVVGEGAGGLRPGDLRWQDFLGAGSQAPLVTGDPYRISNVLFSSGTTGVPKAIPWTHLTPFKCAVDGHFHQDIQPGDVVAWPTSIGWMMGPWLVYATLINGATMALYAGAPHGEGFSRFVERARVTVLGVVPSLVRAWRGGGCPDDVDWSGVRVLSSTGEPSQAADYLWLMNRTGYRAPVVEYCGGTEIGGGHLTGTVVQPCSPGTFSTVALGVDVAVLDEAGQPVEVQETGELFVIPPSIGLSQELLNADHHQEYFEGCPPGPGGEVLRRHGDLVRRLPGGFFRAEGRADDTMNLGGVKVSSLEVERVADRDPRVRESAAVSVRGEEGGERLVLFVVPAGPEAGSLRDDLQGRLAAELNPLFKIHRLVAVEELPRTASNKLLRRELRWRYQED